MLSLASGSAELELGGPARSLNNHLILETFNCTMSTYILGQATKVRERTNMADTRGRGSPPSKAIRNRSRERDRVKEREANDQKITIDREKVQILICMISLKLLISRNSKLNHN